MDTVTETRKREQNVMQRFLCATLELSPEDLRKLYQRYKNKELEYLIAYDMGCGNTSAAIISLRNKFATRIIDWERRAGAWTIPYPSIKTIIGMDALGYLVGEDATTFTGSVENFKTIPDDENLQEQFVVGKKSQGAKSLQEIWTAYFKITFNKCLKWVNAHPQCGGTDVTRDNTIFVVAHPAGKEWCQELLNYRKLIMDATGLPGEQVITFSEAKASMMYARQKRDRTGRLILHGNQETLVIDLGASTIDVLHIDADGTLQREFSLPLAGRNIDELLGHAVLEKRYEEELANYRVDKIPDKTFFTRHKAELHIDYSLYKYNMRSCKEDLCNYPKIAQSIFEKNDTVSQDLLDLLKTRPFCVKCQDMDFVTFMGGKNNAFSATWEQTLTKLVEYVAKGMNDDCQIVLTGGTANLLGVEDCVRTGAAAAGITHPKLVVLNEPTDYEYTVPFGSAEYMMRVLGNLENLENFPDKLEKNLREWICSGFTESVAPLIVADAMSKMNSIVATWKTADKGNTVQGLLNQIAGITYTESQMATLMKKGMDVMSNHPTVAGFPWTTLICHEVEKMCIGLLTQIAPTKEFDSHIDFSKLSFDFKAGTIKYSVQQSLQKIDWLAAQNFWGRWLHGVNDPLSEWQRNHIAGHWAPKNADAIKRNIKSDLLAQVEKQYDDTAGFGIPEMVMDALSKELSLALFQQDDTERS